LEKRLWNFAMHREWSGHLYFPWHG